MIIKKRERGKEMSDNRKYYYLKFSGNFIKFWMLS